MSWKTRKTQNIFQTALNDKMAFDDAGLDDNGPTHPLLILHRLGNNWPIIAYAGLGSMLPARLASLLGGAGAPLDKMDYDYAGLDYDWPTRPPRILHGLGNNWPIISYAGLCLMLPARLASLSGRAGAALDNKTDYDYAGLAYSLMLWLAVTSQSYLMLGVCLRMHHCFKI